MKKVLLLILALSVLGSATVWADDVYNSLKVKKIKVTVNGKEIRDGGVVTEAGRTMLPLREMADTLQALVVWDDDAQTVNVYKPNVDIFPYTTVKGQDSQFGSVFKGKNEFSVTTQVDNLKTKIHSIKLTIVDPAGESVLTHEEQLKDANEEFWFKLTNLTVDFKQTGKYAIQVYMKASKDADYYLVGEKTIRSIQK